jgi:hypothetical protein
MTMFDRFRVWLGDGRNTGADVSARSVGAYMGRVRRVRDVYKARGVFLEDVLRGVRDFDVWHDSEAAVLRGLATSERDFDNTKAFLRAFHRFLQQ